MLYRIPVCILAAVFSAASLFADITLSPIAGKNWTTDLNQALKDHAVVTLNPGTYNHSGIIDIPGGKTLRSLSSSNRAVLYATNTTNMAVRLRGTAPRLENMIVTTNYSGGYPYGGTSPNRTTLSEDCLVFADDATSFNIRFVTAYNGRCGGIKARMGGGASDASRAYIQDCEVYDTLADGIHLSTGASYINVVNNDVYRTGDDMIAVVSYGMSSPICTGNKIIGNDVRSNRWARGITVIGGYDIYISDNDITDTWTNGIQIGSDGGPGSSYTTHRAELIYLVNNTILRPNRGKLSSSAGIVLIGRNPENGVEFAVSKVRMYRNTILGAPEAGTNDVAAICHGVRMGDGSNTTNNRLVYDVVMEDTYIMTAVVGINMSHVQDVTIRARPGNTMADKTSEIGYTYDQAIACTNRCRGTIYVLDTHMDVINRLRPGQTDAQNVDIPAIYMATPVSGLSLVSRIERNHLHYPGSNSLSRLIIAPTVAPNSTPDPGAGNKNTYGGSPAPTLISSPAYLQ